MMPLLRAYLTTQQMIEQQPLVNTPDSPTPESRSASLAVTKPELHLGLEGGYGMIEGALIKRMALWEQVCSLQPERKKISFPVESTGVSIIYRRTNCGPARHRLWLLRIEWLFEALGTISWQKVV